MPRARNIKPALFKNEVLGEADPLLTILFAGLWCLADREGRMEDRPKRIRAEIFPYREITDFNRYLTELERMGFISRYSVDGEAFIQVENFAKHQSPHKTERASEIPEKPPESESCGSTEQAPLSNGKATVKESLIPDSGFRIPDSGLRIADSTKKPASRHARKKPNAASDLDYSPWPELPSNQVMTDYKKIRHAKKAPLSQTVINAMGKELHKLVDAGVSVEQSLTVACVKGWQGFKAEWVLDHLNNESNPSFGGGMSRQAALEARNAKAAAEFAADDGDYFQGNTYEGTY